MKTQNQCIRFFILLMLFFFTMPVFSETIAPEDELWTYLVRQSSQWFAQYTSSSRSGSARDWKEPVQRAFDKLTKNGPEPGTCHKWAIIQDPSFNAACFPGGEIIINEGVLSFLDQIITDKKTFHSEKIDSMSLSQLREELIAPILAHELGHYYNRHMIAFLKAKWQLEKTAPETLDLSLMRYSQKNEFEADYTGYLLLQKGGYDPRIMIQTLEILNMVSRESSKYYTDSGFNIYFLTHPTPHTRLAVFSDLVSDYHKEAASLEQAFSDIQLGVNLYHALQSVEDALKNHPENIYLMTEKSIVLHKIWILSASLYDLKLRGIIETPLFYDKMVYDTTESRDPEKKLPGDQLLWTAAKKSYETIIAKSPAPGILSNYALLLCYSPKPEDETRSKEFARRALRGSMDASYLNNLAVVLFLVNEKDESIKILKDLSLQFDKKYTKLADEATSTHYSSSTLKELEKEFLMHQAANREFVLTDFTPLLNLSAAYWLTGKNAESKAAAFEYLSRYESSSDWAVWLMGLTNTSIPLSENKKAFTVKAITVNESIEQLVSAWGKPSSITERKDDSFTEIWHYDSLQIEVTIEFGSIILITLKEKCPLTISNAFRVGSSRQEIEKFTGDYNRLTRTHTVYEGRQNCAVQYILGTAVEIVLFPSGTASP
ncbi:MAG: M48 family metalloprotease [Spirochaetales bacterium]|nr:M48 family metalloprotease [Spirochaetales bacterium]